MSYWHEDTSTMSESYADELMEGVDVMAHLDGDVHGKGSGKGRIPAHVHAWLITVGALVLLWFIGGVLFKGVNI